MTRSRDPGPAPSDTEDSALWQKAMADVKPLRRRRPRKRRAEPAEPPQAAQRRMHQAQLPAPGTTGGEATSGGRAWANPLKYGCRRQPPQAPQP